MRQVIQVRARCGAQSQRDIGRGQENDQVPGKFVKVFEHPATRRHVVVIPAHVGRVGSAVSTLGTAFRTAQPAGENSQPAEANDHESR